MSTPTVESATYRPEPIVKTPWGDATALKERKLPPGRGNEREAVRQSQRERLFAATVAIVGSKGYAETRVADLLELAGVSRRAFYEHFADKEDCFRATLGELLPGAMARIKAGVEQLLDTADQEWGSEGLDALLSMVAKQPAAARVCLVEAFAAGESGREPLRALGGEAEHLVALATGSKGARTVPRELSWAILGGLHAVICRALREGTEAELPTLAPALARWAQSLLGAPDWVSVQGRGPVRRVASAPFAARIPLERLLGALAALSAERGFAGSAITEICQRAGVSYTTFYENFADKEAAFEAALDSIDAQLLAGIVPAINRAAGWRETLVAAVGSLCAELAAEPDLARLREVEVYSVGPEALAHRSRGDAAIVQTLLALGFESKEQLDPLCLEASLGAMHALLALEIEARGSAGLGRLAPLLGYVAVAPFAGSEAALGLAEAVASDDEREKGES